jgi:hypothetical protein
MSDKKKVIIAFLYTKWDVEKNLINFLNYNSKFKPGYEYDLIICYKLLSSNQIDNLRKITSKYSHKEIIDESDANDFDFGSYKRIAEKYPNNLIFFALGHSYPVANDWLKKIMMHFNENSFIGTSASNESLYSTFIKKKKFRVIFNLFNYFYLKKNFKPFPNPHIRTINFLLLGKEYLEFVKFKNFNNKKDAWNTESGVDGLTNFFIKKKYNVLVVNSEGKAFSPNEFKNSETYCYLNQSKQLFSDKHSRKYDQLTDTNKLKVSNDVWLK